MRSSGSCSAAWAGILRAAIAIHAAKPALIISAGRLIIKFSRLTTQSEMRRYPNRRWAAATGPGQQEPVAIVIHGVLQFGHTFTRLWRIQ